MDTYDDRLAAASIRAANERRYDDEQIFIEGRERIKDAERDSEALNLMRRITNALEGIEKRMEVIDATKT